MARHTTFLKVIGKPFKINDVITTGTENYKVISVDDNEIEIMHWKIPWWKKLFYYIKRLIKKLI
jgi:hypothetical protein